MRQFQILRLSELLKRRLLLSLPLQLELQSPMPDDCLPDTSGTGSVVNSIQESSGLDSRTASTANVDMPHRCEVISLIRHAEV